MKNFVIAALFLSSFSTLAAEKECGLKVTVNTIKEYVKAEVVPASEASGGLLDMKLNCESALVEIINAGINTVEVALEVSLPVLYSQSFNTETIKTLNVKQLLDTAIPKKIVINMAFEGENATFEAVHVKYMDILDRR